jgi:hypothetical protein
LIGKVIMARKQVLLELKHIEDVMRHDISIGSDNAFDGLRKRFCFNPWANEYIIYHGDVRKDAGQAIEELLEQYNAL